MQKYLNFKAIITPGLIFAFLVSTFGPMPIAQAGEFLLPKPGVMVHLSPAFNPLILKGIKVHPENPLRFEFILDKGDSELSNAQIKNESSKLIKYFLASLTIPEKDLWVNLSPYEKDRMIAPNLGQTEMGRDMLAQDYILKQLTASLIYPENGLGKTFWDRVYAKAQQMYGSSQIPVNTFNKVWIVADKADVFEHGNAAYIVGAHLKVMLEEDYLALTRHVASTTHSITSNIIREVILPEIEKEVNTGKNFASLRQMFYSMILASWYKMALKDALLTQIYGNQSKVKVGINQADPKANEEIFNRYLQAYKKGVFNYIKEDISPTNNQPMPRKYFSGGADFAVLAQPGKVLHRFKQLPESVDLNGHFIDVSGISLVKMDQAQSAETAGLKPGSADYLEAIDQMRAEMRLMDDNDDPTLWWMLIFEKKKLETSDVHKAMSDLYQELVGEMTGFVGHNRTIPGNRLLFGIQRQRGQFPVRDRKKIREFYAAAAQYVFAWLDNKEYEIQFNGKDDRHFLSEELRVLVNVEGDDVSFKHITYDKHGNKALHTLTMYKKQRVVDAIQRIWIQAAKKQKRGGLNMQFLYLADDELGKLIVSTVAKLGHLNTEFDMTETGVVGGRGIVLRDQSVDPMVKKVNYLLNLVIGKIDAAMTIHDPATNSTKGAARKTILLVDDEPVEIRLLKSELEKQGYYVMTAPNGREALKLFDENEISLVISDWHLPVMDGLDLIRELRRRGVGEDQLILRTSSMDRSLNQREYFLRMLQTAVGENSISVYGKKHDHWLVWIVEEINRRLARPAAAAVVKSRAVNRHTILLVDDRRAVRIVLKQVLETQGYSVISLGNPDAAKQMLPGLMGVISLVYCNHPEKWGIELYQATRKAGNYALFVIDTGVEWDSEAAKRLFLNTPYSRASGDFSLLYGQKPNLDEIVEKINSIVQRTDFGIPFLPEESFLEKTPEDTLAKIIEHLSGEERILRPLFDQLRYETEYGRSQEQEELIREIQDTMKGTPLDESSIRNIAYLDYRERSKIAQFMVATKLQTFSISIRYDPTLHAYRIDFPFPPLNFTVLIHTYNRYLAREIFNRAVTLARGQFKEGRKVKSEIFSHIWPQLKEEFGNLVTSSQTGRHKVLLVGTIPEASFLRNAFHDLEFIDASTQQEASKIIAEQGHELALVVATHQAGGLQLYEHMSKDMPFLFLDKLNREDPQLPFIKAKEQQYEKMARNYGFSSIYGNEERPDLIKKIMEKIFWGFRYDSAMSAVNKETPTAPGGIDLNGSNMLLNRRQEGQGIQMQFDPAMIEKIKREGFDGLEFQIQSVMPLTNLPAFLGLSETTQRVFKKSIIS